MQAAEFEREALHELPALLAELLAVTEDEVQIKKQPLAPDLRVDAVVMAKGRRWLIEVKTSSSPGTVAAAAAQLANLRTAADADGFAVLVVPYMTPAGAKAAAERNLNWIDLSGNARVRDDPLYISVEGRPNRFTRRGRPSSPFAPKGSRIARVLLLDPSCWWRQKELAEITLLDDGYVSRVVRRLDDDELLERKDGKFRPVDAELLLDAWADDYRFDRHDVVAGHMSGSGVDLALTLDRRLADAGIAHAFTGLPAAWSFGQHARFRLCSVYVDGDPRDAADAIALRRNDKGANVQLIGPDDTGVFKGQREAGGYPCVSPAQVYLDLGHLPERAKEAAHQLRQDKLLWSDHE